VSEGTGLALKRSINIGVFIELRFQSPLIFGTTMVRSERHVPASLLQRKNSHIANWI